MNSSPQQPRAPRFDLNLPLSFKTEDGAELGHCVNVSSSGMLVVFDRPVELFTTGELVMQVGEYYVNIKARVARVLGGDHGLSFQIRSQADHLTVKILVEYAAFRMQPDPANQAIPQPSVAPDSSQLRVL
jgi:hypothetical protein